MPQLFIIPGIIVCQDCFFVCFSNNFSYDVEPNPPFYNRSMIEATLDYLTRSHSGRAKSFVELLSLSPVILAIIFSMFEYLSFIRSLF